MSPMPPASFSTPSPTFRTSTAFPRDFPTIDVATGLAGGVGAHPSIWAIVAEVVGKVGGFNGLDQRGEIARGAIVVDPAAMEKGIAAHDERPCSSDRSMKGVRPESRRRSQ
jgi:hypothetical protein